MLTGSEARGLALSGWRWPDGLKAKGMTADPGFNPGNTLVVGDLRGPASPPTNPRQKDLRTRFSANPKLKKYMCNPEIMTFLRKDILLELLVNGPYLTRTFFQVLVITVVGIISGTTVRNHADMIANLGLFPSQLNDLKTLLPSSDMTGAIFWD